MNPMDEESEERPTPDANDVKKEAEELFEDDPSRNPDDENLKGIKGA